jgi:hypothetical protein
MKTITTRPPALIIGADTGNQKSALVAYDTGGHKIVNTILARNQECRAWLDSWQREDALLAIEQFKSYGNMIGDTVLWSCVWSGRFTEMWNSDTIWIPRKTVVTSLCGDPRAGDKDVRRALIDSFPNTGGGKEPSIGTHARKGPLYGMKGDLWSALAVAIVGRIKYLEIKENFQR